ncbi:unnamed protein product [Gadus morhua 'NCC']
MNPRLIALLAVRRRLRTIPLRLSWLPGGECGSTALIVAGGKATFNWTYVNDIDVNGSSGLIAALNNISLPVHLINRCI